MPAGGACALPPAPNLRCSGEPTVSTQCNRSFLQPQGRQSLSGYEHKAFKSIQLAQRTARKGHHTLDDRLVVEGKWITHTCNGRTAGGRVRAGTPGPRSVELPCRARRCAISGDVPGSCVAPFPETIMYNSVRRLIPARALWRTAGCANLIDERRDAGARRPISTRVLRNHLYTHETAADVRSVRVLRRPWRAVHHPTSFRNCARGCLGAIACTTRKENKHSATGSARLAGVPTTSVAQLQPASSTARARNMNGVDRSVPRKRQGEPACHLQMHTS